MTSRSPTPSLEPLLAAAYARVRRALITRHALRATAASLVLRVAYVDQSARQIGLDSDRLTQLVLHRWVRLEQEGATFDVYSRHLAYVLTEDGVFVNAALVRDGLARVSARVPLARLPELQRAEAEAQAFRRGMWGSAPQIPGPSYTQGLKVGRAPASRTRTAASRRRKTRKKEP